MRGAAVVIPPGSRPARGDAPVTNRSTSRMIWSPARACHSRAGRARR